MNQPRLIKCLVLGLPIGLFLTGACSLIWHFRHPQSTEKVPENQQKSKPVSSEDLEFYVTRLANDVGARPATDQSKSKQAASFIEGTLGTNNIGYTKVQRENFTVNGMELSNISVEVTGSAEAPEIILVAAHYDSLANSPGANLNATGVAANLSLANLFLRTAPYRTIRFLFIANGLGHSDNGAEKLGASLQSKQAPVVAAFHLDGIGNFSTQPNSQRPLFGSPIVFPTTGNFLAFLGNEPARTLLFECKTTFTANSTMTAESAIMADSGSQIQQTFARAGFPSIRITDTGASRSRPITAPLDTPDGVNFPQFSEAVRALGRMLVSMTAEK